MIDETWCKTRLWVNFHLFFKYLCLYISGCLFQRFLFFCHFWPQVCLTKIEKLEYNLSNRFIHQFTRFVSTWGEDSECCEVSGGYLPTPWRMPGGWSTGSEVRAGWGGMLCTSFDSFRFYQLCLETRGGDTLCSTDRLFLKMKISCTLIYKLQIILGFLMEGLWQFPLSLTCAGSKSPHNQAKTEIMQ